MVRRSSRTITGEGEPAANRTISPQVFLDERIMAATHNSEEHVPAKPDRVNEPHGVVPSPGPHKPTCPRPEARHWVLDAAGEQRLHTGELSRRLGRGPEGDRLVPDDGTEARPCTTLILDNPLEEAVVDLICESCRKENLPPPQSRLRFVLLVDFRGDAFSEDLLSVCRPSQNEELGRRPS